MKRLLFLFLMIVTACTPLNATSTPASFFNQTPVPANLSLGSTSEQIQRTMWESAIQWKIVQMDGVVTRFTDGVPVQAFHEQVWLDPLNNRYKVEWTGILNSLDKFLRFSDGNIIHHVNLNSGQIETFSYPDTARVGQYVPPLVEGEAYPNPIWSQMGTPLSQLAFPSDYAQNKGSFKVLAMDMIAAEIQ